MEKYDVVIIGGGLGSLTTATYLSKRLRNVAVFEEGQKNKLELYSKRFRDQDYNWFNFNFYHHDLGGVHEGDLLYEYMKRCGLQDKFEYYDNKYAMIIGTDRKITKRPNNIDGFRTYLVRHYPKQRNEIHDLFADIKRHYKDYREQKLARLNNKEYTISSPLIEWGDLSLFEVLNKYFTNLQLINEFTLVYDTVGFDVNEVNAYHYFIKFFDTFIDGAHFIKTSFKDVVKTFSNEISKTREKLFTDRKIKTFNIKNDKIVSVVDEDGVEIKAKHFVINMRIDEFKETYAEDKEDLVDTFNEMYPAIKQEKAINQVYIGLLKEAKELGILENQYIFSEIPQDSVRLLSIVNYKGIDSKSAKDGQGAILVEFLDDDTPRKEKLNQVIDQVTKYFPKLVDQIADARLGNKQPYFSSKANESYWDDKTINDLFDLDDYCALNPIKNAYFIGSWIKPESGITGMIQTGIEYGDIIDDAIYHGEDEEYFITHDELMNIIAHQFIANSLGKEEKNVQFFVGKDSYYIRTKAKHQRLYKGVSDISDIIIIATNECLYDLSVGNTTLEKALNNGTLEYVGEREFLEDVIDAFDMGIEIESAQRYQHIQGKWGIQFMLVTFGVLLMSNLLANYHNYIIIAPITALLLGVIMYAKRRILKLLTTFEYVTLTLYVLLAMASFIYQPLNELKDSKYTLTFFALYLLFTWFVNRPVAFGYIRHDYRVDYTRTKLLKKMTGGITFIWGVIFLIIAALSFTLVRSYSSLGYYIGVIGLALTYFYPGFYTRGNIDQ